MPRGKRIWSGRPSASWSRPCAPWGGGVGIDRHKMLKMIKERLAKEKGIVI